jgi:hypothetical protein
MYDITKQPIWVQDEIASLERQLETAQKRIAELETEDVVTYGADLGWSRPVGFQLQHSDKIMTLPQGTTVYFKQRRGYVQIRQKSHDMNRLQIMTASRRLQIRPEVSNVIEVTMEEDG